MVDRQKLQTILENLLGSRNVYFQPPESVRMNYPAIVYSLEKIESVYANDGVYLSKKKYSVTVMDKSPDSVIADKVSGLPACAFKQFYEKDNLNHYVFSLLF